ncbi:MULTISPECIES: hypothetical protein [unclassified Microbacterium]|uniref:hypothetical protein n=1 Tax=unclassified Microbacterium TaxID=2609290 RepID=UPI000EA97A74|nr:MULTISPECIES: hypothetical protein [unclassified Microbacterium]MBT2486538.1 hypothetical protein [Microbacterium sp. ISL-108]RKN69229.1 hypothetical protein D7252_17700 [Microbacterium sp. CGR2]
MDEVIDFFTEVSDLRQRFGFTIDFAAADEGDSRFVWALSHEDWDQAQAEYEDSPARADLFEGRALPIRGRTIAMVDRVDPSAGRARPTGP